MKTLQESIIGRKGAGYFRGKLLSNPKKSDLQHLDVLKTRDGGCCVCLDYKQCSSGIRRQITSRDTLEAYTIPGIAAWTVWGLWSHPDDDIVEVYRGVLDNANYDSFLDLWGDLQNKMVLK